MNRKRLLKRWSQVDLASYCGLENSYISRLEKGSRTPSLDVIMRVSRAFKMSPERLVKEIRIEFEQLTR
jgi:transcriptional regulator with XRE-family HTH domain